MSFPYLSDLINYIFGTHWNLPIATFGSFVALAILIASVFAKQELLRYIKIGALPPAMTKNGKHQPTDLILNDLIIIAILFGLIGARLFHLLEYPIEFMNDPMAMLFSRSGFSIYGGLVFGLVAGIIYVKQRAIPIIVMLDAMAPALILGYGIGRLGCHISGDGDWGIAADMALKPLWLPDWFWAQTYENNVIGAIIQSPGVYPTPLYESAASFFIFVLLWAIRNHPYDRGFVFSLYMLLSGFERLLIEKIRINSQYHIGDIAFTQAEFISITLIVAGSWGVIKTANIKQGTKLLFSVLVFGLLTACVKL